MEINITNMQNLILNPDLESFIEKVLGQAMALEELEHSTEVSVVLVDNDYIQQLNKTYRGLDKPTDVLSFALEEMTEDEPDFFEAEESERVLGDIVISLERAKEQAEEYGHSFEREVAFLAVHGLLHLLGFDHIDKEDEVVMRAREENILTQLGIKR